ncbi:hypothetical protein IC582_026738 [Cucumis melo]|uniref:Zinc finger CCCH domain-containing protein 24 n=1 Tax=Cucumis melo var. makuwa TaxID=1194695 RepID=A0A5D3CSW9_CUCMM|nr:zinc finger CCCH domain-containing protein 24 [Cucumis melo var. makuwa]TYK14298.1 zinc finger CCCH domain-containing protein 24 [Cucumis melo var. makuwa]
MAASSIEETLLTQPPKTSDDHLQTSMDVQDDTENLTVTTAPPPESLPDQTDLQSDGASVAGEKRKRTDPDSDAAKPNSDPSTNPLWRTSLCSYFRRHSGSCSHGTECRYAHGEEELRQRPDKSWDPTSERAKKVMKVGEEVKEEEVMMTEVVVDDDEVGNDGRDNELSKCLVHLPTKWNSDNLRNYLNEQSVLFKSAKKKKGMTVGFVSFESTEQLRSSVEELQGKIIGKKNLKVADVIPRSFEKKIKSSMDCDNSSVSSAAFSLPSDDGQDAGNINDGSSTPNDSVLKGKSAREVVAPLAHMSYSDQLDHKKNSLLHVLKKLTRNARKACPHGVSLPEWILKSRDIGGIACSFEGIIESPIINGYRNKCEFSVGYSLEGKPTVGFMLGNFREGVTAVEEPENCPNVSRISCKYASIFQEFLQSSSLPIWNRFKNIGFWRQLTVREGRAPGKLIDSDNSDASISEVMLIVQVCSVGVESELMTSEFKRLAQAFAEGSVANSPPLPLTALVIQHHQGISNAAPADTPLQPLTIPKVHSAELEATNDAVEPRIHDYISNLKFCISPTAFFQVNTLAAEKLYSLAGDWAELGPDTLLFDICCGTGTIGLTLAHRVGMVVGIEMNASAVSDAQRNAEINGINNCKFICAKAEDVIGSLLKEYLKGTKKEEEIVCDSNGSDGISSTSKQNEEISGASEKNDETPGASEKSGEIQDAKEKSDEVSETGERNALINDKDRDPVVNHVPENDANGPETSEVASEKNGSQHSCCNPENGTKQFKNVVAIVDPPRGGLHPIVTKVLRTHTHLRRLVYISCNPESLMANAIELCTPSSEKIEKGNKNNRGWRNMGSAGLARHRVKSMPISEPFRPVKAMAVDLFPHTPHCEMVMLLER